MIRTLILAAILASPVIAQDSVAIQTSAVTLTRDAGNIVVSFWNDSKNRASDTGEYRLAIDGLPVRIAFGWNVAGGADAIYITPPAGWVCAPSCGIVLPEGQTGQVVLFPVELVGA